MRIEKFLSEQTGYTRTEIKKLIQRKQIKVNSNIISKSIQIIPQVDHVFINDQEIIYEEFQYFILNKPANYISSNVNENKYLSVLNLVNSSRKNLIIFGRLDVGTEGLLIISDDSKFYHQIFHSSKDVFKTYFVKLEKELSLEQKELIESGIQYDKTLFSKPCKINFLDSKQDLLIKISEGKFHQIKKMFSSVDNSVIYLKRVAIGGLNLETLNLDLGESIKVSKQFLEEQIFKSN